MKKTLIKCVYLAAVFVISLILAGSFLNQGNTDMTMEMGPATYPVIHMKIDEYPLSSNIFARMASVTKAAARSFKRPYYYMKELQGLDVEITGLDLKADVIGKCNGLADKYGYGGLRFQQRLTRLWDR